MEIISRLNDRLEKINHLAQKISTLKAENDDLAVENSLLTEENGLLREEAIQLKEKLNAAENNATQYLSERDTIIERVERLIEVLDSIPDSD